MSTNATSPDSSRESPEPRLRELARGQASANHYAERSNGYFDAHTCERFDLCPHADCRLVREGVPIAAAASLRRAWDHGIKTAIGYGDNVGHLQGAQADRHFETFLVREGVALVSPREPSYRIDVPVDAKGRVICESRSPDGDGLPIVKGLGDERATPPACGEGSHQLVRPEQGRLHPNGTADRNDESLLKPADGSEPSDSLSLIREAMDTVSFSALRQYIQPHEARQLDLIGRLRNALIEKQAAGVLVSPHPQAETLQSIQRRLGVSVAEAMNIQLSGPAGGALEDATISSSESTGASDRLDRLIRQLRALAQEYQGGAVTLHRSRFDIVSGGLIAFTESSPIAAGYLRQCAYDLLALIEDSEVFHAQQIDQAAGVPASPQGKDQP